MQWHTPTQWTDVGDHWYWISEMLKNVAEEGLPIESPAMNLDPLLWLYLRNIPYKLGSWSSCSASLTGLWYYNKWEIKTLLTIVSYTIFLFQDVYVDVKTCFWSDSTEIWGDSRDDISSILDGVKFIYCWYHYVWHCIQWNSSWSWFSPLESQTGYLKICSVQHHLWRLTLDIIYGCVYEMHL